MRSKISYLLVALLVTSLSFSQKKEKIKGSKILVINALRIEKHYSHFNLEEAISLVNELEVEKAYFTHISHHLGFHDIVEKSLPDNVKIAYDQLQIFI